MTNARRNENVKCFEHNFLIGFSGRFLGDTFKLFKVRLGAPISVMSFLYPKERFKRSEAQQNDVVSCSVMVFLSPYKTFSLSVSFFTSATDSHANEETFSCDSDYKSSINSP